MIYVDTWDWLVSKFCSIIYVVWCGIDMIMETWWMIWNYCEYGNDTELWWLLDWYGVAMIMESVESIW